MSGGRFDYLQYRLSEVIDHIDQEIRKSGRPKTDLELKEEASWRGASWYENYPEDLNHGVYREDVLQEFKKGAEAIAKAQVYMQRIDWLLSGDDGEETFLERLEKDLERIKRRDDGGDQA